MRRRRAAFTLIELMVAMALTLFIMAILSQAFIAAVDTFSGLKGIGDMQEAMRVAVLALRHDLAQDHFEGKRRLSDPFRQPVEGFLFVQQGSVQTMPALPPPSPSPGYCFEGNDADGIESARAFDHLLYFTVKLRGNRTENFFRATVNDPNGAAPTVNFNNLFTHSYLRPNPPNADPFAEATQRTQGNIYHTPWAEVAYYLKRTGSTEEAENAASPLGLPLFALYRMQLAVLPDTRDVDQKYAYFNPKPTAPVVNPHPLGNMRFYPNNTFREVACTGKVLDPNNTQLNHVDFHSPNDLTQFGTAAEPLVPTRSLQRDLPPTPPGPPDPLTRFVLRGAAGEVFRATPPMPPQPGAPSFDELPETPLLTNVISFQVQVMLQGTDTTGGGSSPYKSAYFDDLRTSTFNNAGGIYDTGFDPVSSRPGGRAFVNVPGLVPPNRTIDNCSILALKITLRIWDAKTRQVRQTTFIQEM